MILKTIAKYMNCDVNEVISEDVRDELRKNKQMKRMIEKYRKIRKDLADKIKSAQPQEDVEKYKKERVVILDKIKELDKEIKDYNAELKKTRDYDKLMDKGRR